jgi:hypothetical protein
VAQEMERFRTYSQVELAVNPEGFAVDTGVTPEYMEKKIDLPESWIKGFNQVSSAANLGGVTIELAPVDMYDICSFLRRHKAHKSPRYMKWIKEKDQPLRILFEPQGKELELKTVYSGNKNREEKIWGRQRWLVVEKLLPLAKSFTVKFLGFGMPQFIVADLGYMKMTIGFSSWSANDWVKGTAFNIMSGFISDGEYKKVYNLLKEKRQMTVEELGSALPGNLKSEIVSGIGSLFKRGEGYFDPVDNKVRFRRLCNVPIARELYETTETELAVKDLLDTGLDRFKMSLNQEGEYFFANVYKDEKDLTTEMTIDGDGQISSLKCGCREFNKGPRNISAPCPHILALYMFSLRFTQLKLQPERIYTINDIMTEFLG